jgi:hypothetical protein
MTPLSQKSVTLVTLDLLQKTLDYLNRLPVVPVTRELCKEIESHLSDTTVLAAKLQARAASQNAAIRVAQKFSPAGELMAIVVVSPDSVAYRFPGIKNGGGVEWLRKGEILPLHSIEDKLKLLPVDYEVVTDPKHKICAFDYLLTNRAFTGNWTIASQVNGVVGKFIADAGANIYYVAKPMT